MTARTRTEAACLQAAERDIRTAAMTGTLDRIWRDAEQTPAMQFLKRNEAAIDAIRAARIAEGGVL
jgi:hypothetical protein